MRDQKKEHDGLKYVNLIAWIDVLMGYEASYSEEVVYRQQYTRLYNKLFFLFLKNKKEGQNREGFVYLLNYGNKRVASLWNAVFRLWYNCFNDANQIVTYIQNKSLSKREHKVDENKRRSLLLAPTSPLSTYHLNQVCYCFYDTFKTGWQRNYNKIHSCSNFIFCELIW